MGLARIALSLSFASVALTTPDLEYAAQNSEFGRLVDLSVTQRFDSIAELQTVAPSPPEAQDLANELMAKYESDPQFGDVVIVADREITVALKSARDETSIVGNIKVTVQSTALSLRDFDEISVRIAAAKTPIHEVSFDFLTNTLTASTSGDPDAAITFMGSLDLPLGVSIEALSAKPAVLEAAEGAMLSNGSGCTTGFRVKFGNPPVWRITSANHSLCSTWTTVNGVAMTYQGGVCEIDTSIASGSSTAPSLGGIPFSGVQGNPANGSQVYKYGVVTGWSFGTRGAASNSTESCAVPVYKYTGMSHSSGDSGGPYITLNGSCPSCSYSARGTHRAGVGVSTTYAVRMWNINNAGFTVG